MTIKSLNISGFQSHKATLIKFHSGVNSITGNSDCGKSAILRALNWVITNKVSDKSFRTRGMKKTDVEVVFTDGQEVSRTQDNHNCYYLVDAKNKVDLEFTAFKNLIPEDIANALNLSDLNISNQFDSPFLLSDSAGEVARKLNQVSGLSDIDIAISNIKKQVLANNREIGTTEQILKDLQTQKEGFAYLEQMEKDVLAYERFENEFCQILQDENNISTYILRIEQITNEIALLDSFLNAQTDYDAVASMSLELKSATESYEALQHVISECLRLKDELNEIDRELSGENDLNICLGLLEDSKIVTDDFISLDFAVKRVLVDEGKIRTLNKNIDSWEMEFNALMPNQCPLCGGAVK